MSEPLRIGLRLFGFLILLIGVASLVTLVTPGPSEVADWMGESCAHSRNATNEQCTVGDVIEVALAAPILILVGGVLTLALRPPHKGPLTLDLSGWRR